MKAFTWLGLHSKNKAASNVLTVNTKVSHKCVMKSGLTRCDTSTSMLSAGWKRNGCPLCIRLFDLPTLAERRLSLCSTLFRQTTSESHALHYLLPAKCDATLVSRLRSTLKYPTVRARTNRYENSFIPYSLSNFQRHLQS